MRTLFLALALVLLYFSAYCQEQPFPEISDKTIEAINHIYQYADNEDFERADSAMQALRINGSNYKSQGLSDMNMLMLGLHGGYIYNSLGAYPNSLEYLNVCDSILESNPSFLLIKDFYSVYDKMSTAYRCLQQLDKAAEYQEKSLILCQRLFGSYSPETADAYRKLSLIASMQGNFPKATKYLEKCIQIKKEIISPDEAGQDEIVDLMNLSLFYYTNNDTQKAYGLGKIVEEALAETAPLSKLHLRMANMLFKMSVVARPEETEAWVEKLMSILDSIPDDEELSEVISMTINNIALYYADTDPQTAIDLIGGIVAELKEKGEDKSLTYAISLNNYVYLAGLDAPDAPELLSESFDIVTTHHSTDISDALQTGINLITSHFIQKDSAGVITASERLQKYLGEKLYGAFNYLTEDERTLYWNQVQPWYQAYLPDLAMTINDERMNRLWYDALLQSRSILLSSSVALADLVAQSDDPELKRTYGQISEAKDIEAGENLRKALENRILSDAGKYGSFMDLMKADVKGVRSRLASEDAAIEFVRYDATVPEEPSTDSIAVEGLVQTPDIRYLALVIRSDSDMPERVALCTEQELAGASPDRLYNLIWVPLAEHLDGIRNVYFSPDGELFSLPIEYAKLPTDGYLWDKYNCFRLTSTRELLKSKKSAGKGTVLFGGMKYDLALDSLVNDAKLYNNLRDVDADMVQERGTRDVLLHTRPLPGTLKETEELKSLIDGLSASHDRRTVSTQANDPVAKLYIGERATEAAFKSVSGHRNRNIHIATHGFFDKNKSVNADTVAIESESDIINAEKEAMSQCGLLFSGVDNVRFGEKIPEGVEDGVLYAYEISGLDFTGTDIVSLSACRTALGKVAGDGVFGLQRGFKKAGVNSILMSLWSVDDDATCRFMTEFYSRLLGDGPEKGNKAEALKGARKAIMSIPKWNDPKYWAPFILLDAIN